MRTKGVPSLQRKVGIVAALVISALLSMAPSAAQTPGEIDQIREQLLADFDPGRLGSGYGAIVSFAVSPDITSATFYPDHGSGVADPTIKVIRVPYRHVFGEDNGGSRPFVQALLAYQTFDALFEPAPDESVDSRWRTYGAAASFGYEVPLSDHLVLLPAVNASYGRVDNRAQYSGTISESVLQPVFQGVLFDWDADVLVYGASVAMDYKQSFGTYDVEVLGGLTYHRVDSFHTSSSFVDIETDITAFDIELNSVHPTGINLGAFPLSVVGLLGNTTLLGPNRDALGFDQFFEAGLALEMDISSLGWKLQSLRLGAKWIFGPDVDGWSLVLGYGS